MAGKSKRNLTASDLRAMARGRAITVIKPDGRTELRVSKSRLAKPGRRS